MAVDDTQFVRFLGHWLIYLQLVKYSLPKTAEDDWFLFLLGLIQVLIGSVVNEGDRLGVWLFLWAMLAVWVLGQFFLQREADRFQPDEMPAVAVGVGLARRRSLPRPARLGLRGATLRIADAHAGARRPLLSAAAAAGGGHPEPLPGGAWPQHLTGFDDEVRLGQLGEILENDTVVMSVEFADERGKPTHPDGEPLCRGVTLTEYENGRWRRQLQRPQQTIVAMTSTATSVENRRKVIRQSIKLEPNDSPNAVRASGPSSNWAPRSRLPPSSTRSTAPSAAPKTVAPTIIPFSPTPIPMPPRNGETAIALGSPRLDALLGKDMDPRLRNQLRRSPCRWCSIFPTTRPRRQSRPAPGAWRPISANRAGSAIPST